MSDALASVLHANSHLRLVLRDEPVPALDLALLRYRQAEAALVQTVQCLFPRGNALTLLLAGGTTPDGFDGEPAAAEVTVMAVVCADDVLQRVALVLRDERSGRAVELPLAEVLAQLRQAEAR